MFDYWKLCVYMFICCVCIQYMYHVLIISYPHMFDAEIIVKHCVKPYIVVVVNPKKKSEKKNKKNNHPEMVASWVYHIKSWKVMVK